MELSNLDIPLVLSTLFYPRPARPNTSHHPNAQDGTIPVSENVVLGYRLYPHTPESTVILYFHGNGEIASDYDGLALEYHRVGASLLVVDYRGYGWSTGTPKVSTLLSDTTAVVEAVPGLLTHAGLPADTLVIMGRSLGSACAIHAAHQSPDRFKGLIIESGFARAVNLLQRLGLPAHMIANLHDPIGNDVKIASIELPLLVIHGENDALLPVEHGQTLFDQSPAIDKQILRVPHAGHNDLLFVALQRYFDAIGQFIAQIR
ncbi:MAG: alpha/beta hydrolase [Chloroflexi bacterium]|nr:alpha/beta hydrolase [Chloroflexota bacterium]